MRQVLHLCDAAVTPSHRLGDRSRAMGPSETRSGPASRCGHVPEPPTPVGPPPFIERTGTRAAASSIGRVPAHRASGRAPGKRHAVPLARSPPHRKVAGRARAGRPTLEVRSCRVRIARVPWQLARHGCGIDRAEPFTEHFEGGGDGALDAGGIARSGSGSDLFDEVVVAHGSLSLSRALRPQKTCLSDVQAQPNQKPPLGIKARV